MSNPYRQGAPQGRPGWNQPGSFNVSNSQMFNQRQQQTNPFEGLSTTSHQTNPFLAVLNQPPPRFGGSGYNQSRQQYSDLYAGIDSDQDKSWQSNNRFTGPNANQGARQSGRFPGPNSNQGQGKRFSGPNGNHGPREPGRPGNMQGPRQSSRYTSPNANQASRQPGPNTSLSTQQKSNRFTGPGTSHNPQQRTRFPGHNSNQNNSGKNNEQSNTQGQNVAKRFDEPATSKGQQRFGGPRPANQQQTNRFQRPPASQSQPQSNRFENPKPKQDQSTPVMSGDLEIIQCPQKSEVQQQDDAAKRDVSGSKVKEASTADDDDGSPQNAKLEANKSSRRTLMSVPASQSQKVETNPSDRKPTKGGDQLLEDDDDLYLYSDEAAQSDPDKHNEEEMDEKDSGKPTIASGESQVNNPSSFSGPGNAAHESHETKHRGQKSEVSDFNPSNRSENKIISSDSGSYNQEASSKKVPSLFDKDLSQLPGLANTKATKSILKRPKRATYAEEESDIFFDKAANPDLDRSKHQSGYNDETKISDDDGNEEGYVNCDVCCISFPSKEAYESHSKGFLHMSRLVAKREKDARANKQYTSGESPQAKLKENPSKQTAPPGGNESHQSKRIKCKLCNIECTGPKNWEQHISGTKHIQRYNQTEAELGPALFYERYGDTPIGSKALPSAPSSDEKTPKSDSLYKEHRESRKRLDVDKRQDDDRGRSEIRRHERNTDDDYRSSYQHRSDYSRSDHSREGRSHSRDDRSRSDYSPYERSRSGDFATREHYARDEFDDSPVRRSRLSRSPDVYSDYRRESGSYHRERDRFSEERRFDYREERDRRSLERAPDERRYDRETDQRERSRQIFDYSHSYDEDSRSSYGGRTKDEDRFQPEGPGDRYACDRDDKHSSFGAQPALSRYQSESPLLSPPPFTSDIAAATLSNLPRRMQEVELLIRDLDVDAVKKRELRNILIDHLKKDADVDILALKSFVTQFMSVQKLSAKLGNILGQSNLSGQQQQYFEPVPEQSVEGTWLPGLGPEQDNSNRFSTSVFQPFSSSQPVASTNLTHHDNALYQGSTMSSSRSEPLYGDQETFASSGFSQSNAGPQPAASQQNCPTVFSQLPVEASKISLSDEAQRSIQDALKLFGKNAPLGGVGQSSTGGMNLNLNVLADLGRNQQMGNLTQNQPVGSFEQNQSVESFGQNQSTGFFGQNQSTFGQVQSMPNVSRQNVPYSNTGQIQQPASVYGTAPVSQVGLNVSAHSGSTLFPVSGKPTFPILSAQKPAEPERNMSKSLSHFPVSVSSKDPFMSREIHRVPDDKPRSGHIPAEKRDVHLFPTVSGKKSTSKEFSEPVYDSPKERDLEKYMNPMSSPTRRFRDERSIPGLSIHPDFSREFENERDLIREMDKYRDYDERRRTPSPEPPFLEESSLYSDIPGLGPSRSERPDRFKPRKPDSPVSSVYSMAKDREPFKLSTQKAGFPKMYSPERKMDVDYRDKFANLDRRDEKSSLASHGTAQYRDRDRRSPSPVSMSKYINPERSSLVGPEKPLESARPFLPQQNLSQGAIYGPGPDIKKPVNVPQPKPADLEKKRELDKLKEWEEQTRLFIQGKLDDYSGKKDKEKDYRKSRSRSRSFDRDSYRSHERRRSRSYDSRNRGHSRSWSRSRSRDRDYSRERSFKRDRDYSKEKDYKSDRSYSKDKFYKSQRDYKDFDYKSDRDFSREKDYRKEMDFRDKDYYRKEPGRSLDKESSRSFKDDDYRKDYKESHRNVKGGDFRMETSLGVVDKDYRKEKTYSMSKAQERGKYFSKFDEGGKDLKKTIIYKTIAEKLKEAKYGKSENIKKKKVPTATLR